MEFKGSIIITDPGYIAKRGDWGNLKAFDWKNDLIGLEDFSNYLFTSNCCGDSDWDVWLTGEQKSLEDLKNVVLTSTKDEDIVQHKKELTFSHTGTYCADTGMICVLLVDEVMKYNPDFFEKYPKFTYTIIEDFEGEIELCRAPGSIVVVGSGNKSFMSW